VAEHVFTDPKAWGASIRDAREEARLNQNVLAELLGMSRQRLGRIEDGYEEKKPRKPNERRAISIAVAEFTGHRDRLGLSEPEPSAVDQLRRELHDEMDAMKTELLEEIDQVRHAQASGQRSPRPAEED
jgi:DNA-binding XRE family transcriptional regulator